MQSKFIHLISFFFSHSKSLIISSVVIGILAGAGSAALMILITSRVTGAVGVTPAVYVFIGLALFVLASTTVSGLLSTRLAHRTSLHLRMHLCRQILTTPLRRMEEAGAHRILTVLTNDVNTIIIALLRVPVLFINFAIVFGGLFYLGWLSPKILIVLTIFVIVAIVSYVIPQQRAIFHMTLAREEFSKLFNHMRTLINGAKELKLHRSRRAAFLDDVIEPAAQVVRKHSLNGEGLYVLLNSWSQVLYFVGIGFILFAVPVFLTTVNLQTLTSYALTVLYISGPIQLLVSIIPSFSQATIALKKIEELGVSLSGSDTNERMLAAAPDQLGWKRLEFEGVTHTYYREREDGQFTFGPVSLSFAPGELVFLVGGNGSGKTTFAKIACGLYIPESGQISLDGVPINEANIDDYRQYFSVVFTEIHLFEQLLGLPREGLDSLALDYLKQLHLDQKVEIKDGKLSTTDLSHGQRKRLALLTAFLEDRPIYIFDEWAADQDPIFKETFYYSILPALQVRGKTVIVITHDDRYFHLADRLIKLDYGKIEADRRGDAMTDYALADAFHPERARQILKPGFDMPELKRGTVVAETTFADLERLRGNGRGSAVEPIVAVDGSLPRGVVTTEPGLTLFGRRSLGLLATILFIVASVFIATSSQTPPAPLPANAPLEQFSSGRAMQHLRVVAAKPHPIGSSAHDEVREYLLQTLRDAGLSPEVQNSLVITQNRRTHVIANVQNVVARVPGTEPGSEALMLAAHYDSVANSPGASDDGAGVVTLLETIRALKTGPALKNDLLFLFTDGEEHGLLGARAFAEEHRWAKDVGLVLNFEARGSRGPVYMFETSEGNKWLIDEFDKTVPHPFASSLMSSLYKLMPNETDMNVFKKAGMAGLNFAYIKGVGQYHNASDTVDSLDEGSVQHHGTYALALAQHFGNLPLNQSRGSDAIYFDLLGRTLITYPQSWAMPLSIAVVLVFAATFFVGWKKKQLTLPGTFFGSLVLLLSALSSAVVVTSAWWAITALHPQFNAYSNAGILTISFINLTLCVTLTLMLVFSRWIRWTNLIAGALLGWLVALGVVSWLLPSGSYLFAWPLLFSLLALAFSLFAKERDKWTIPGLLILCLCTLPGILLLTTFMSNVFAGLALTIPSAIVILEVLLIGMLLPHLRNISAQYRWLLVIVSGLLGSVFLIIGTIAPIYDNQNPRLDSLVYNFDVNKNETTWMSYDGGVDEWTAQFFPASVITDRKSESQRLVANAPSITLPKDEHSVVADGVVDGLRTIHLRFRSPRQPRLLNLSVESSVEIASATINGRRFVYDPPRPGRAPSGWGFSYMNLPDDGLDLILETRSSNTLQMNLVSYTDGLPNIPGMVVKPRPQNLVPAINSDLTRVSQTIELPVPAR